MENFSPKLAKYFGCTSRCNYLTSDNGKTYNLQWWSASLIGSICIPSTHTNREK